MTMLRDAVMQAAARPELRAAVARVYADLQREIDARKPLCTASGRCCRFDQYGHRLYVTTIELAAFVSQLRDAGSNSQSAIGNRQSAIASPPGGCPFQLDGLCSVHTIRPFGCRVFFCDATSDEWQHQQYERFHAELKGLHEKFGVPYQYVEWREALRQLDLAPTATGKPFQPESKHLSLPQLPF
jgi:Fe-S-cluster containining protein